MIRHAFGEENISRTLKVQTQRDREKARQVKSKVKSMFIIFFLTSRRLFTKTFVLEGQTVNATYYCDVLRRLRESVRRLGPNWLLHQDNAPSHTSF
jgi:hypothetical protein